MKWTHGYEQSGKTPFSQRRESLYRMLSPFEPGRIRFHILNIDPQGVYCFDNHLQFRNRRLPARNVLACEAGGPPGNRRVLVPRHT
jgi:hypothetical protein